MFEICKEIHKGCIFKSTKNIYEEPKGCVQLTHFSQNSLMFFQGPEGRLTESPAILILGFI